MAFTLFVVYEHYLPERSAGKYLYAHDFTLTIRHHELWVAEFTRTQDIAILCKYFHIAEVKMEKIRPNMQTRIYFLGSISIEDICFPSLVPIQSLNIIG